MTKYGLKVQLEIPHNLFGPSVQISQLFGIFLKKVLITCPLSMLYIITCYVFCTESNAMVTADGEIVNQAVTFG